MPGQEPATAALPVAAIQKVAVVELSKPPSDVAIDANVCSHCHLDLVKGRWTHCCHLLFLRLEFYRLGKKCVLALSATVQRHGRVAAAQ